MTSASVCQAELALEDPSDEPLVKVLSHEIEQLRTEPRRTLRFALCHQAPSAPNGDNAGVPPGYALAWYQALVHERERMRLRVLPLFHYRYAHLSEHVRLWLPSYTGNPVAQTRTVHYRDVWSTTGPSSSSSSSNAFRVVCSAVTDAIVAPPARPYAAVRWEVVSEERLIDGPFVYVFRRVGQGSSTDDACDHPHVEANMELRCTEGDAEYWKSHDNRYVAIQTLGCLRTMVGGAARAAVRFRSINQQHAS